ncbi:MAG: type II toxin-antitoxin system RelE/ParE family toxin [Candidatus Hydrogenedentes bacterium]|nr:type II toxin-antitoxin system RelE/ParE family toxin [Candidatus Hydrogenedentota bacterium]MBI3117950.1 type II toxin-antitoxin system RelE/ParE family toxin [Candidatus Hydrogenedentota bacterium]
MTFHTDAEAEFDEAVAYYDECRVGLGDDFYLEVYSAIQRIAEYPEAWPIQEADVRRCQTNRFPYGIFYSITEGEILVLAIRHSRRDTESWKHRMRR